MRYGFQNLLSVALSIICPASLFAIDADSFRAETLPVELTVGYAVRSLDVNADGKLDIAIVDSKRILWLEAPSWKTHVIYETPDAKFDNVCFAPYDINKDGLIDFAVGSDWQPNNTKSGGKIGWIEHVSQGPWQYHAISEEPTTHRMNWFQTGSGDPVQLLVAPLKGKNTTGPGFDQSGVRFTAFLPTLNGDHVEWNASILTEQLPVMHNFRGFDLDSDGKQEIITASFDGVSMIKVEDNRATIQRIGAGQETAAPAKGASEIGIGTLADRSNYLATIEPWHGDKVVVYRPVEGWQNQKRLWSRHVLDEQLAWGHAVACADLDNDANDELIVGVRDNQSDAHRCGVRIYDPTSESPSQWQRTILDAGSVAVEDLTTGDFDTDGDIDIVAVGRATHNAKIYWNQTIKQ
jgi:hypothetical protein